MLLTIDSDVGSPSYKDVSILANQVEGKPTHTQRSAPKLRVYLLNISEICL